MKILSIKKCSIKVDDDIYEKYQNKSLHISSHGYPVYNKTYLHALVLSKKIGYVIDHIDGDKFNNQRSNLRHATRSQNAQNTRRNRGISKYLGVSKYNEQWKAKSKRKYLGHFDTEEQAAYAYDLYATDVFGPNALLNNIAKPIDWDSDYMVPVAKKSSLAKGVYTSGKRFTAVYNYRGRNTHIGMFDSVEDASAAVTSAEETRDLEILEEHMNLTIEYKDGIAVIPITNCKKDITYALVDENKWHDLTLTKWSNSRGYCISPRNGKQVSMHRYVLNYSGPLVVDHINGNKADNRVDNLRVVTNGMNVHNRPKKKGCASKYIGVRKSTKGCFPWDSQMRYQGKMQYLGNFYTEEQAAEAYNERAIEIYGPNCRLNILN
uniref:HNH endonuclease n=1 Tax=Marseillevirus LCMAC201 TaxID=2506605 RepID=A0A481YX50_9VIRU|nr:MAG: HNH endonuclease [Marseillevirus LCMAC201]